MMLSWLYLLLFDFALGCFIFDQLSSFVGAYIFIILVYTAIDSSCSIRLGSGRRGPPKIRPWVFMATATGSGLDMYRIPQRANACRASCVHTAHKHNPLPLSCNLPSIPRPAYPPLFLAAFLLGSLFTSSAVI
ncbi:hypothetical protein BKA82DRAFT_4109823 [Pisolithus tinctorius]|nr:hypothetical protein BKA82DRAFT_4109823 [Pisolithus tinctorius]